jgi:heme ABC exporter ATP-binding subunit CcmA
MGATGPVEKVAQRVTSIEAHGLEFSFGPARALRGLSLQVENGSATAVFGPNGAGKTTLLKVIAGLLRPDAGTVRVQGLEIGRDPARFRRLIGFISHQPLVYPQLTGRENLEFYGRLYGLANPAAEARKMLDEMGLTDWADRAASAYSRGLLQRLAIGRALLHQPSVLLMDEPFTGLDEQARERLENLLGDLRDGRRTVLLATHDLDAGLRLAERVAVLYRGRMILEEPAARLDRDIVAGRLGEAASGNSPAGAVRSVS